MKHGKNYTDSKKIVESDKLYDLAEACEVVCKTAKAKFVETVELHVRLGVDSRHADQQVRGAVVLPHGTGKNVRTLVFAKGDNEKAAQEAGDVYKRQVRICRAVCGHYTTPASPRGIIRAKKTGRAAAPRCAPG